MWPILSIKSTTMKTILKVFGKEKGMLDLDIKKCKYNGQHYSAYSVIYKTHKNKCGSFEPVDLSKKGKDACYSSFFTRMKEGENRITTTIEIPREKHKLSKEEAERWIDLCMENSLLPDYVSKQTIFDEDIKNATIVFDIYHVFQGTIYIYLDSFRKLREDPGFIKAIIYMCDEKNVDFYIAYVIATHLNTSGTGHHILPFTKSDHYDTWNGVAPNCLKTGVLNLKACRALYRFLYDPEVDRNAVVGKNAVRWKVNSHIKTLANKNLKIPIKHLNNPKVLDIIHEFNEEKAEKMYKEFMEEIKENQ